MIELLYFCGMKLSLEDKLKRGFLLLCGVLFALPTYFLWKEVLAGHQWPDDFNGWLGLFMFPAFSILSFVYALSMSMPLNP